MSNEKKKDETEIEKKKTTSNEGTRGEEESKVNPKIGAARRMSSGGLKDSPLPPSKDN